MKQYLALMRDVIEGYEQAKSTRNHAASRHKLLQAIELLSSVSHACESKTPELATLLDKIVRELSRIISKLALPKSPANKNLATSLLLRNKLKPTDDGKTDSAGN